MREESQGLYPKKTISYTIEMFRLNGKEMVFLANKTNSLSHTKWMCKYHIVFTPKYRRKVIYNQVRRDLIEIFENLCKYKGVEIIEGHMMRDHVHMLVSIPPKISISSFMGYLKGKSAMMIFDKHANLKYKYGNRKFWAEGYYVSTVGLNEATVAKYVREQEMHDQAIDKLSVKEYEDPFGDGGFRSKK
jgi:putative transposase